MKLNKIWIKNWIKTSLIFLSVRFRESSWCCSAGIYLFKVKNRNPRTIFGVSLKLTMKTPERCHWCSSGVYSELWTDFTRCSGVFIVEFEQVNASREEILEISLKPVYFCKDSRLGNCFLFTTYFQWLRELNIWFPAYQVYIPERCH